MDKTPKTQTKVKTHMRDYIQLRPFYTAKETVSRVQGWPCEELRRLPTGKGHVSDIPRN